MPTLRGLCCPKDLGNPKKEIGVEFRASRQTSEGLDGGTTLRERISEKFQEGVRREEEGSGK